jgi:hypothetical protein
MIKDLAELYNAGYDAKYYEPYIDRGRAGDIDALEKLTEWKNPGANDKPMPFVNHRWKRAAWKRFEKWCNERLIDDRASLRETFAYRSPVWAMFWHHVLFGTPIFDVNTNLAFHFFAYRRRIRRDDARIVAGNHWQLYDDYCCWFGGELQRLRGQDNRINERMLDRALFEWGRRLGNTLPVSCYCD